MTTPNPETEMPEPETELPTPDTYHNPATVIRIASTIKMLSWVILIVWGGVWLAGIVLVLRAGFDFINNFPSFLNALANILPALFYFGVLQALGEGLYILLDIESNGRRTIV